MEVSQQITNILNYYKEHPGCDPNMYEFIGVCHDVAMYLQKEVPNYDIYASKACDENGKKI